MKKKKNSDVQKELKSHYAPYTLLFAFVGLAYQGKNILCLDSL
jgi:hypothetical protein